MKYDLIITGQLFQLVNVQDAHISLPISRTIPIIIIAVVAPAKIAINPIIEYHAATVLMASAVSNVSNPKNIRPHPKNSERSDMCSVCQPMADITVDIGSINDF